MIISNLLTDQTQNIFTSESTKVPKVYLTQFWRFPTDDIWLVTMLY